MNATQLTQIASILGIDSIEVITAEIAGITPEFSARICGLWIQHVTTTSETAGKESWYVLCDDASAMHWLPEELASYVQRLEVGRITSPQ